MMLDFDMLKPTSGCIRMTNEGGFFGTSQLALRLPLFDLRVNKA
jgi:hypothetical protein